VLAVGATATYDVPGEERLVAIFALRGIDIDMDIGVNYD
jgi:hypothetical protein